MNKNNYQKKKQWRRRQSRQDYDGENTRRGRGNKKRRYGYGSERRKTIRKPIPMNTSVSEYSDEDFDEMGVRKDADNFGAVAFAVFCTLGVVCAMYWGVTEIFSL